MSKRKIYSVCGDLNFLNWMEGEYVNHMEDADLCAFSGGSDVTSSLYGKSSHPTTWSNPGRDEYEMRAFERAKELGKHMIGTCRGAQFLSVCAGGILVQHQQDNYYRHRIHTVSGRTPIVTSSHHQAQNPWDLPADDYKVLGWTVGLSPFHWGEHDGDELVIGRAPENREVEEAYYPRIKALCLQHHVEYDWGAFLRGDEQAIEYVTHARDLLDKHMADAL